MQNDDRPPVPRMPADQLGFDAPPDNSDLFAGQGAGAPQFDVMGGDEMFDVSGAPGAQNDGIAPPRQGPNGRRPRSPRSGPVSFDGLQTGDLGDPEAQPASVARATPAAAGPKPFLGIQNWTPIVIGASLVAGFVIIKAMVDRD